MITVTNYKGLKVQKKVIAVTDEMVEQALSQLLEQHQDVVSVTDRPAKEGDITIIDFKGFVDGVAFAGGEAEKYELELGSGAFIPGFEEQIVGHSVGEEFDVNVSFPEQYHSKDLAGKASVFKIVLHEIQEKKTSEANDEFAQKFNIATLDELKAEIKKQQEAQANQSAEIDVINSLIAQVTANVEGEIDEALFETEVDTIIQHITMELSQQGMNLEQYLKITNSTEEDLRKEYRADAEKQVKMRFALEYIAEKEEITASDAEVELEYAKLSTMYRCPVEQIKKDIDADLMKKDVLAQKALRFIREHAVEA